MAHSKFGRDRKPGFVSRGHVFGPVVCLITLLPLMTACDSLLDAAGLERKSNQDIASPLATAAGDPAPAPPARKHNPRDLANSKKIAGIQNMLG